MYPEVVPYSAGSQVCRIADPDGQHPRSIALTIDRLLQARNYAEETGRNIWEFAVTITELRRDGVSESDLRWLVCRGYAEQAKEISMAGSERTFDRHASLRFSKRTAFVITDAGVTFSRDSSERFARSDDSHNVRVRFAENGLQPSRSNVVEEARRSSNGKIPPKWDRDRRELRLGGKLVKVFKLPSPMQEAILMAFEEENWPPRIDDPLPVHPDLLPKRRLHDTIKSLNRNQKNSLIRFMGDGTGEGIRWELASAPDED